MGKLLASYSDSTLVINFDKHSSLLLHKLKAWMLNCQVNCNIDFKNFCHHQVKNFKSVRTKLKYCSQLSKAPKAKEKSQQSAKARYYTKKFYYFWEMSLTLARCHNFSLNSVKVRQIEGKYCQNDLEKLSNIGWISLTFIRARENGQMLGKLYPELKRKFTVFNEVFLIPKH